MYSPSNLKSTEIDIPGDFSSAAFFILAALIIPNSNLIIKNVGMNETRVALLTAFQEMGAEINILDKKGEFEPRADLHVKFSKLKGINLDSNLVPNLIDELPAFFIAASRSSGLTIVRGAEELRHKESDRLEAMGVCGYKIGSGECNNYPLIEHIAAFGKPIILSTGMNGIQDIQKAVNIFKSFDIPFALLHTTNIYPTPDHLVRLGAMTELSQTFPDAIVGLSDHTITNHSSFGAIALGASIIERHFTDSMKRDGPDISCSMDPASAKDLLDGIDIQSLRNRYILECFRVT